MELRHLTYFVAVAEERSFTRAAERLWVAQPGLSTQIRRLEAELGVQLLERHPRGVEPTAPGELLLERARAALAAAEVARNTGHDLQAGLVGSIRVGLATGAAWGEAPALLQAFARERPDVEVTVFEAYAGALLRELHDGRLHAVLAPAPARTGELHATGVGSVPWLVLAGAGHSLARDTGPVAAHELDGEAVVVTRHRDGTMYDDAVAATLSELGAAPELRRGGPGPALFADVADGTRRAGHVRRRSRCGRRRASARPLPVRGIRRAVARRRARARPRSVHRRGRSRRARPSRPARGGVTLGSPRQRAVELAPRADRELREHLAQVVGDRVRPERELPLGCRRSLARPGSRKPTPPRRRAARTDEVLITSTTRELVPVVRIAAAEGEWRVGDVRPGPVTRRLLEAFRARARRSPP